MPTYLPAGLDLNCIDSSQSPFPSVLNQVTKTLKELGCTFVRFDRFAQIFRHLTVPSYRTCSTNGSAPKYPWESRCIQLQAKIIVHRDFDLLLGAEVAFRRLD